MATIQCDYTFGMDFGTGCDTATMQKRGDAVERPEAVPISIGRGQQTNINLQKIERLEDFQSAFHFAEQAEVSYGLFGGSEKFEYTKNVKWHEYSIFVLASVTIQNSFQQMRDVQLKPAALELLRNGQTERFSEEFGDAFVIGLLTGGAYYATFEFVAHSSDEYEAMSAHVDAGMGFWSASADFAKSVHEFQSAGHLNIRMFQQGGSNAAQPNDVDGIINKALNFAQEVTDDKAVPYVALVQDYRSLDLPAVPNYVDLENAKSVLRNYYSLRNQLIEQMNKIDYILGHADEFDNVEGFNLPARRIDIVNNLNIITGSASNCVNNVKQCQYQPINVQVAEFPQRKQTPLAPSPPRMPVVADYVIATSGTNNAVK